MVGSLARKASQTRTVFAILSPLALQHIGRSDYLRRLHWPRVEVSTSVPGDWTVRLKLHGDLERRGEAMAGHSCSSVCRSLRWRQSRSTCLDMSIKTMDQQSSRTRWTQTPLRSPSPDLRELHAASAILSRRGHRRSSEPDQWLCTSGLRCQTTREAELTF